MAAYDPKRPRPAQLSDGPAPVDALIDAPDTAPDAESDTTSDTTSDTEATSVPPAEPRVIDPPEPVVVHSPTRGGAPAEVPVAPAPEVGTANRAVLYASIGVAAALAVIAVVLRLRSRRAVAPSAD